MRLGSGVAPVLSCTKYRGLVSSDEYFKNRQIYSADISNYKVVKENWLAYATNHLTEGSIGIQREYPLACVSPIYTVFSCKDCADPEFMFLLLKSEPLLAAYLVHEQASVERRGAVRYSDFSRIEVDLPPHHEQHRIAEILSTVDEAIDQTEALIAKTQQIKAGLMHDLFTRGVTADGQLRLPREEAPQLYKESLLGWIPKKWEVKQLASLYGEAARNGLYKPARFHGRGPHMVQMGNMFRGLSVDFSGAGRVEVTSTELATYGLREGDLLFGRRSLVMEGAGKCALVDKLHEPSTFESSIIRVRLDSDRISPGFAALFLSSDAAYRDRRRFIRQVAVSGVSGADVKQFLMVLPLPEEQATICASIGAASHQLETAESERRKLVMLKHGLMGDLLTGRVLVAVPAETDVLEAPANV